MGNFSEQVWVLSNERHQCIAISLVVCIWAFSNKGTTHLDLEVGDAFDRTEKAEVPVLSR